MKQRILSLLLCCVLLLGIVSTAVYAEAAPAGTPLTQELIESKKGGGVYVVKEQNNRFTMDGGSISSCKMGNDVPNAVHADGTFDNNTKIDKSLLSGINGGQTGQANDPILIGSAEGLNDFRTR